MNWPRRLGVLLVAAGVVLLGIYLVPTLCGAAMSHLAVAEFRAQSSSDRLWDSSRIRAYERTLAVAFPPTEAVLRVPKVGLVVPVLEGTSSLTLNRGVGHITGTALPGESGNIAITGHRDGFFRVLKDLAPGDVIDLDLPPTATGSPLGQTERYVIRDTKVVFPSDTAVLNETTGSTLTLITCYPFYFIGAAPQRYVVQATLLPSAPSPGSSARTSHAVETTHTETIPGE
jgi:sortase A